MANAPGRAPPANRLAEAALRRELYFFTLYRSLEAALIVFLAFSPLAGPFAELRHPVLAKATAIAKASPLWDGQVINVQVSDAKPQAMEIRVLASASDSSRAWDLRCEIREKLIDFIHAPDNRR